MNEHYGLDRLRAAIQNQQDAGGTCLSLPFADASALLEELTEQRRRDLAATNDWRGRLANLRIDLGLTEENPEHYHGDGIVSCSRAMRSMCAGWEDFAERPVPLACAYWAVTAFKYLWRFPLKGNPKEDLMKAVDCANRALDAWGSRR